MYTRIIEAPQADFTPHRLIINVWYHTEIHHNRQMLKPQYVQSTWSSGLNRRIKISAIYLPIKIYFILMLPSSRPTLLPPVVGCSGHVLVQHISDGSLLTQSGSGLQEHLHCDSGGLKKRHWLFCYFRTFTALIFYFKLLDNPFKAKKIKNNCEHQLVFRSKLLC